MPHKRLTPMWIWMAASQKRVCTQTIHANVATSLTHTLENMIAEKYKHIHTDTRTSQRTNHRNFITQKIWILNHSKAPFICGFCRQIQMHSANLCTNGKFPVQRFASHGVCVLEPFFVHRFNIGHICWCHYFGGLVPLLQQSLNVHSNVRLYVESYTTHTLHLKLWAVGWIVAIVALTWYVMCHKHPQIQIKI